MNKATVGNMLHLYGKYGMQIDYGVRLSLKMTEEVDREILAHAIVKTQQRFP